MSKKFSLLWRNKQRLALMKLTYGPTNLPPLLRCRATSDELKLNEEYEPRFEEIMDQLKHLR